MYRALPGIPLWLDEATEAQNSDGRELEVGWGSAVKLRLQKGRGWPLSMEERWLGHHVISAHTDLCRSLLTHPPASPLTPLSVFWAPARVVL